MIDDYNSSDLAFRPEVSGLLAREDFERRDIKGSVDRAMEGPGELTEEDKFVLGALNSEVLGGDI